MENLNAVRDQAFEQARRYETDYGGCAQCVLGAVMDTVGGETVTDDVFRSATGLAAGLAGAGYACGALTGGILALGCFLGRDREHFDDPAGIRFQTFRMARKLVDRFQAEYGPDGGNCAAIQTRLMGRSYDILRGERDEFLANGGHTTVCPVVCGNAASWVVEILAEEGLI